MASLLFMRNSLVSKFSFPWLAPATLLAVGLSTLSANAQTLYSPIPMPDGNEVADSLTDKDIPTGSGGFARDYLVTFNQDEQLVIDLTSEEFDTTITLIAPDGSAVAENDDAPDGSTNSMLFARVTKPGNYIIRVSPYAGQGVGQFNLKVTKLRAEN
jgi:hypothetical protein